MATMPNNGAKMYRRGADFERQVRDDLMVRGYLAIRTPASKSPFDIIAIKRIGYTHLIQCKADGRCDPDEWNELFDLARAHGAIPAIASRPTRGKIVYEELLDGKYGRAKQPKQEIIP